MKPLRLELQSRKHDLATNPVVAGWLPEDDPELWLQEATALRNQGLANDPEILPVTLEGETKGAVLFPSPEENVKFGPRVLPLIQLLPNVLSLRTAELSLGLLDPEIRFSLFPEDLYLFLPGSGLVVLRKEDCLHPRDLLLLDHSATSWNHAQHGIPQLPKLSSIRVELPNQEEIDLSSLNTDGVGSKQGEKLDKTNPLVQLGKTLGFGLVAGPIIGLGKIINMLPDGPGATSPSAFDKLEKWANENWEKIVSARRRELDRLVDLMDKNPEEGLKYALPLGGHDAGRGKAAPGWKLGMRSTRLGNTQGGGLVDSWDIDYETQLKLNRQYRAAAEEAEAKGNHERAAYIYGELLNDWNSAAKALTKAGRYREAVSIYLHKLKDKRRAAEAFSKAGLYQQAAELYLQINDYEAAGDHLLKMGRAEEARELWLQAAEKETDLFQKGRLFSVKLDDIPSAVTALEESWRSNKLAEICLERQFELLHDSNREDEIHQLIEDFTSAPPSIFDPLKKVQICLMQKRLLPKDTFGPPLEEAVYQIVSQQLTSNPSSKLSKNLLKEFKRIRKSDQLLTRDTVRFTQHQRVTKLAATEERSGHLTPVTCIGIPQAGTWQSLAPVGENISVAGLIKGSMVVAQIQNRSCMGSELKTSDYQGGSHTIHHLGLTGSRHRARIFHFVEKQTLHFRALNSSRTMEHDQIGSLQNVLAIGPVDADAFVVLCYTETGALVAYRYSVRGIRERSDTLDLAPPELAQARWFCASRNGHSCYSANLFLAWRHPDGNIVSCELNEPIAKLSMTSNAKGVTALISGQHDVAIITPNKRSDRQPEFVNLFSGSGNHPTRATFANNHDIVMVSGNAGQIFSEGGYLSAAATFEFPKEEGHAIDIAPRGPQGFVILTNKGRLILFD